MWRYDPVLSKIQYFQPGIYCIIHYYHYFIFRFLDLYEYIRKKDVGGGDLSVSERCDIIWKDLTTASKEDVEKIQQATTGQSESSLWQKARSYHITASKCHNVMTRMTTLQKRPKANTRKSDQENVVFQGSYYTCNGNWKKMGKESH